MFFSGPCCTIQLSHVEAIVMSPHLHKGQVTLLASGRKDLSADLNYGINLISQYLTVKCAKVLLTSFLETGVPWIN